MLDLKGNEIMSIVRSGGAYAADFSPNGQQILVGGYGKPEAFDLKGKKQ